MKEESQQIIQKVVFVGDATVGKTSLLRRVADNQFVSQFVCTIGVDFKIKVYRVANTNVKVQFWDTAGQERFRSIQRPYYRGCHAVLICFDLGNRQSFRQLSHWIEEAEKYGEGAGIYLIGCKSDLMPQVYTDQIIVFAQKHNLTYYQTSAKENEGVLESFENIVNETAQKQFEKLALEKGRDNQADLLVPSKASSSGGSKKGCC